MRRTMTAFPGVRRPGTAQGSSFRLFALRASDDLGHKIADALGEPLASHEERDFEDGEHKARPLDNVRGTDVYVVQSLHGGPDDSANDKLCRLLFFIGALKDAGARRVTALVPYLCYARKDRRTKPGDPVTTRYVASLFEAVGTDVVVTLEVHNAAVFENAFRCPTVALTSAPLFVDYWQTPDRPAPDDEEVCVISPDPGGVKRADLFRDALQAALGRPVAKGIADKHRGADGIHGDFFAGDVAGRTAVIVDDMVSTGATLLHAARWARQAGAVRVIALVTHGLFTAGAADAIADPAIDRIAVTDTVPPFRLGEHAPRCKIDTVHAAPLLAEVVRRLHGEEVLADLLVL